MNKKLSRLSLLLAMPMMISACGKGMHMTVPAPQKINPVVANGQPTSTITAKDGSNIMLGNSDPAANVGIPGDLFMNSLSGDLFQKGAGDLGWQKKGNLRGPSGTNSPFDIAKGLHFGPKKPVDDGTDGLYIDTDTGNLYLMKSGQEPKLIMNLKGPAGDDGEVGAAGANGSNGTNGAAGLKGDKGDKGDAGVAGAAGAVGATGAQGAKGDTGTSGISQKLLVGPGAPDSIQGQVGDFFYNEATHNFYAKMNATTWTIIANFDGAAGAPGAQGIAGPVGPQGEKGDQGDAGIAGAAGAKGDKGDKGDQGDAGIAGAAGAKGDKGDKGDQGDAGIAGAAGAKGDKGDKGDQGDAGIAGAAGAQGEKGDKGDKGDQGEAGSAGAAGAQGDKGDKGDKGDQGLPGQNAEITIFDGLPPANSVIQLKLPDAGLNFAHNKYDVDASSSQKLQATAIALKMQSPKIAHVIVIGQTDRTGSKEYNLTLSRNRANAVERGLTLPGFDGNHITSRGVGMPETTSCLNPKTDNCLLDRFVSINIELADGLTPEEQKAVADDLNTEFKRIWKK